MIDVLDLLEATISPSEGPQSRSGLHGMHTLYKVDSGLQTVLVICT